MHPRIHACIIISRFKKKIIACYTSSMIHIVCICITPPTFLRFMKKGKKWKIQKESSQFVSSYHAMYTHSHHVIHHTPQNHWKSFPKKIKKFEKKVSNDIFFVSRTNVRHSCGVCPYFKKKFRFSFYTSRPSARQWSLIPLCLHQDLLRGNGHWFFCHI